jgi:ubiquinol-cytochrome c reductase cytochrome b subunit
MTLTAKAANGTGRWVDDRLGSSNFVRRSLNKVFPDHWSFMLGEIALYTFIILLLSGTYLAFFYTPSLTEVVYDGSYTPLVGVADERGLRLDADIAFDVRGGLLMRQIHHWAALLFMVSIVVHLMRVFFTGAFRKPRELNWVIGVLLLILGILEGFAGYSLPDDLLSGTGLRIAWSIMLAVPVVGTWVAFLIFGSEYPGTDILDRLYIAHVFIVPLILLGPDHRHLMMIWYQKHTQFAVPAAPRPTSSAAGCTRRTRPRPVASSSWCSASSRAWAAWRRSTRCGSTARTTPRRSAPARSPTGTSAGWTARPA